jgi:uncharacterized protein (TIGR02996 family)
VSDHDALVRAICEHPDEDTPRLILADWLEENADASHAEYIRAQIEYANTPQWEPAAVRYKWQRPDVATGNAVWLKQTLPRLDNFHLEWAGEPFRRGFGWWLMLRTPSQWSEHAVPLFERVPIGRVTFWPGVLDDWRKIAASRELRHLRDIILVGSPIEPLFALRDQPAACNIRDIRFLRSSGAGMPEVLEDLYRSQLGHAVRGLHFHTGYESLEAFVDALNTGTALERLSFSVMGITGEWLSRLFDGVSASELTELHFRDEPLGRDGLRVLAEKCPPTLRRLTLESVAAQGDGVEFLARSERLGNLACLDLRRNPLTPRAFRALSLSRGLPSLRTLGLCDCRVGDKGLRHITQAKWWSQLVELDLRRNPISRVGIQYLLDTTPPPNLAALVFDSEVSGSLRSALIRKFGDAVIFETQPHD